MIIIGEARDCDELIEVYKARKIALGLTDKWFDENSGLAQGHIGKLLGDGQSKRLGHDSISVINQNMALKFLVVVDEAMAERVRPRWEGRERPERTMPARASKKAIERFQPIIRQQFNQSIASAGGKARHAKLSPAKLRAIGKRAARARWSKKKAARENVPRTEVGPVE